MPALTYDSIVVGQGLAGSAVAWHLQFQGLRPLIIDAGAGQTASKIAAGLIMPISGRRMAEWPNYAEDYAYSSRFYRQVEEQVDASFFHELVVERLFQDSQQREDYDQRAASFRTQTKLKEDGTGFLMAGARLKVAAYLLATRRYFESQKALIECRLDLEKDISITAQGVSIDKLNLKAGRVYFCQGHEGACNPWFPNVPNRPVRGEILRVSIPEAPRNVLCTEYWMAPVEVPGQQGGTAQESTHVLVGATYDRLNLTSGPTEEASQTLQKFVQQVTGQQPTVVAQYSGVRASTANRQIVVQRHPDHANVVVVNGLGSRGSLLAPLAAQKAVELRDKSANVLGSKKQGSGKSVTQLAHNIHRRNLKPGDQVLDATAGNGHDTLFLARIVGSENVTAMDLQPEALDSAKTRLSSENQTGVRWLQGDHAVLLEQQERDGRRFRGIVFNLGYLPGGDKTIVTQKSSTIRALAAAERLLAEGGVMTVVAYPGHDAGREEEQYLQAEASRRATSEKPIDRIAGKEDDPLSPVLYVYRS